MPLQSIYTSGINSEGGLETLPFSVLVLAIIFGWILVSLLQRFFEDLVYQTFGMNPKSTWHSLLILVVMFFLFILFIWFVDNLQLIPVSSAGTSLSEATGGLIKANESSTAPSNVVAQQLSNTKNGNPIVMLNTGI